MKTVEEVKYEEILKNKRIRDSIRSAEERIENKYNGPQAMMDAEIAVMELNLLIKQGQYRKRCSDLGALPFDFDTLAKSATENEILEAEDLCKTPNPEYQKEGIAKLRELQNKGFYGKRATDLYIEDEK